MDEEVRSRLRFVVDAKDHAAIRRDDILRQRRWMANLGAAQFLEQEVGRPTVLLLPEHRREQQAVVVVGRERDRGKFVLRAHESVLNLINRWTRWCAFPQGVQT